MKLNRKGTAKDCTNIKRIKIHRILNNFMLINFTTEIKWTKFLERHKLQRLTLENILIT